MSAQIDERDFGERPGPSVARWYFQSEEQFRQMAQAARERASGRSEKAFAEEIGKRANNWGLRARITSNQASWLQQISRREPPAKKVKKGTT